MALFFTKKNIFSEADSNEIDFLNPHSDPIPHKSARYFPPEWFPQSGVQIAWPHEGSDWKYILPEIEELYVRLSFEIAKRELLLIVSPEVSHVKELLSERLPQRFLKNIRFASISTDDTWSRDNAFLSVVEGNDVCLLDFCFNGWGNKFTARKDNVINQQLIRQNALKGKYQSHKNFILEGGSVESDGAGTILTTAQCLLSEQRNASLSQADIEQRLKDCFAAEQVLWLQWGHLAGDDTDGHIDTLARFAPDSTIVYTKCNNPNDEHYTPLLEMEKELQQFHTAAGEPYRLVGLPLPSPIYAHTQTGALVEDAEKNRAEVERLPATYANFLILNNAVLFPTYNQPENDSLAKATLQKVFPELEIVGINCLPLIKQHGSLHCATMQFPKGVLA